jgi:desulfoferrodoxin (superoxide reductase-like protein)
MTDEISRRGFVSYAGALALGTWLPGCMARVGVGSDGSNADWEARAEALEGAKVYDSTTPWSDGTDKAGTHVPKVTVSGNTLLILVEHPTTVEHYITTVYVRDQDGIIIAFVRYGAPEADSELPGVVVDPLTLDGSVTEVTVYAHCNLHNVWKAAPQAIG